MHDLSVNIARVGLNYRFLGGDPWSSPPVAMPVKAPVLGIWSSGDMALTEQQMTGSAAYVDGPWRYERIEGAGHWMQLERPDDINALLLDFLGE